MSRKLLYIIILFALILGLTGCDNSPEPTNSSVDPVFREFYELLGGKEVIGPVISIKYEENNKKLQFTTAALMVFDPKAPESSRFQLAPLGNAMNVSEAPTAQNSYEIYPGFLPLFRRLGGTRYTGLPLTSVKADPENHRVVQYFENIGFYQLTTDAPDESHLLHYGVWKCAYACNYESPQESIVMPPSTPGHGISNVVDLLDFGLTGIPLSEIYVSSEGQEEQIFENVIIYANPASPGGITLRPLPLLLGIPPDEPIAAGGGDGKFIAIEGNEGFYVPYYFDEYIESNNGYEFIGFPITYYNQISDDLSRQCYENICLEYHPNENDDLKIRPMPLGRQYKQQMDNNSSQGNGTNSFNAVTLTVWEQDPVITSSEPQEIHAMVLDNGDPLKNIDLVLVITKPNGDLETFNFPPTGTDGQASLEVGALNASNGTLIVYQVCVDNVEDRPDCISDDYLIWGNP